jgi:3-hydroxyacyl-CoA dehydrogenase/enoyl-CoA hydratase/3-hydroxybutyryl-CoA epimerase
LACRYRVAVGDERLSLGLPEVLLGIHPGFGGTVRAVRIAGVRPAMEMMLTGKSVRADKALRIGLVDKLVATAEELQAAARDLILQRPAPRKALRDHRSLVSVRSPRRGGLRSRGPLDRASFHHRDVAQPGARILAAGPPESLGRQECG